MGEEQVRNGEMKEAPVMIPQVGGLQQPVPVKEVIVTSEMVKEWRQQYLNEGHTLPSTQTYYSFLKKFVGYEVKVSQTTVNMFRNKNMSGGASGALKTFFRYLVEKKEYPDWLLDIRLGKSKKVKKQPTTLTVSEVLKIIEVMPGKRDKNLTILLFYLGLRLSEGMKLLWSDFAWDEWLKNKSEDGSVTLRHTKGDKFRVIPVPSYVMLKLYNDHENKSSSGIPIGEHVCDYDFLDYVHYEIRDNGILIKETKEGKENRLREERYRYIIHAESYYRDLIYKISKEVIGKRVNPHLLRHVQAQDLMNKGLGIEYLKSFLGHSSITSTEVYAQASPELLKREMKKIRDNSSVVQAGLERHPHEVEVGSSNLPTAIEDGKKLKGEVVNEETKDLNTTNNM